MSGLQSAETFAPCRQLDTDVGPERQLLAHGFGVAWGPAANVRDQQAAAVLEQPARVTFAKVIDIGRGVDEVRRGGGMPAVGCQVPERRSPR